MIRMAHCGKQPMRFSNKTCARLLQEKLKRDSSDCRHFRDSYWSNKNDQSGISRRGPLCLYPIVGGEVKNKIFARMALNHSLTLTLGCKNEKQPSGPIELDLEAGNLVYL